MFYQKKFDIKENGAWIRFEWQFIFSENCQCQFDTLLFSKQHKNTFSSQLTVQQLFCYMFDTKQARNNEDPDSFEF
jgi:hypothetical protein